MSDVAIDMKARENSGGRCRGRIDYPLTVAGAAVQGTFQVWCKV